uniref:Uncharacterized protein n=1 Tax=Anguilla anguilla TaxID=7936 RepID=A0A0E9WA99_ANGAN
MLFWTFVQSPPTALDSLKRPLQKEKVHLLQTDQN